MISKPQRTTKYCEQIIKHLNYCIGVNRRARQRLSKWNLVTKIAYLFGEFCLKWERYDWKIYRDRLRIRHKC